MRHLDGPMRMFSPDAEPGVSTDGIPNIAPKEGGIGPFANMSEDPPPADEPEAPGPEEGPPTPEPDPSEQAAEPDAAQPDQQSASDEPGESDEAPQTQPADEAPPDEGEPTTTGDDAVPAALAGVLKKYGADPVKMGSALVNLRKLQQGTAEENRKFEHIIEQNFRVNSEGELELRPDAAARALGKQPAKAKASQGAPQLPTEAEVREAIEAQYRERLSDEYDDPELVNQVIKERWKPLIDQAVQQQMTANESMVRAAELAEQTRLSQKVDGFLNEVPQARDHLPAMSEFFDGFPEELRGSVLEHTDLNFLYRAVTAQDEIRRAAVEAFQAGMEEARKAMESAPTDATKPTPSGRAQRHTRTTADPEAEFKARIIGGNGLIPVSSLVSS